MEPVFRYFGDKLAARQHYFHALKFANHVLNTITPGHDVKGPFRRRFHDGTEYRVMDSGAGPVVDIYAPTKIVQREGEAKEKAKYPVYGVLLNINLVYPTPWTSDNLYGSKISDEKTWYEKQGDSDGGYTKDLLRFFELTEERIDIVNLNKAINRNSAVSTTQATAHAFPWAFYTATIGKDVSGRLLAPDTVSQPEGLSYEEKDLTAFFYPTGDEHSDSYVLPNIYPTLEDFKNLYTVATEEIQKGLGLLATRPCKVFCVVLNLQEWARPYQSKAYREQYEYWPNDKTDGVEPFVKWLCEQGRANEVMVNHWHTCRHYINGEMEGYTALYPGYGSDITGGSSSCKGKKTESVGEYLEGEEISTWQYKKSPYYERWILWLNLAIQRHIGKDNSVYDKYLIPHHTGWAHYSGYCKYLFDSEWYHWNDGAGDSSNRVEFYWLRDDYNHDVVWYVCNLNAYALQQEFNTYIERYNCIKPEYTISGYNEDENFNGLKGLRDFVSSTWEEAPVDWDWVGELGSGDYLLPLGESNLIDYMVESGRWDESPAEKRYADTLAHMESNFIESKNIAPSWLQEDIQELA